MSESGLREVIEMSVSRADSRETMWVDFLNRAEVESAAEVGVWTGEFSAHLLRSCSTIARYYMVDPWRHLDDWNKPLNVSNDHFDEAFDEAMARMRFAEDRTVVLRGRTTEVIDEIPDGTLDFVYVDGDHTLKGISIDLIRSFAKVRSGGAIGGDDLSPSIWQHGREHEPTLVFPFVVYFAEATGSTLLALPYNQYLLIKAEEANRRFEFVDLTGRYGDVGLRSQLLGTRPPLTIVRRYASAASRRVRRAARGLFDRRQDR